MNPVETVLAFLDAINRHDIDMLAELMTEDHLFVDSLGNSTEGRAKMRNGWQGYFALCPDYRIVHEHIFQSGDRVGAFGFAGGTIQVDGKLSAQNRWKIPAAWHALVHNGLIKEWRVYADNKPVYEILAKTSNLAGE